MFWPRVIAARATHFSLAVTMGGRLLHLSPPKCTFALERWDRQNRQNVGLLLHEDEHNWTEAPSNSVGFRSNPPPAHQILIQWWSDWSMWHFQNLVQVQAPPCLHEWLSRESHCRSMGWHIPTHGSFGASFTMETTCTKLQVHAEALSPSGPVWIQPLRHSQQLCKQQWSTWHATPCHLVAPGWRGAPGNFWPLQPKDPWKIWL